MLRNETWGDSITQPINFACFSWYYACTYLKAVDPHRIYGARRWVPGQRSNTCAFSFTFHAWREFPPSGQYMSNFCLWDRGCLPRIFHCWRKSHCRWSHWSIPLRKCRRILKSKILWKKTTGFYTLPKAKREMSKRLEGRVTRNIACRRNKRATTFRWAKNREWVRPTEENLLMLTEIWIN